MNADYLQLSDRRCRIRIGKTTFYVKTVVPPQDGWPTGERTKGTYDVDDGTETRRVEAWNPAEAVQPSAPAFTSVVPPVRSYAYSGPVSISPAQPPAATPWTDPRIVGVVPVPGAPGTTRRYYYYYQFKGGWTCVAPDEADAVHQYDTRNSP